ncbi:unnamed protein product [Coregonus sp. 'balchen']|nr:unnamed protein product [Coregonus sp. 'balchen']
MVVVPAVILAADVVLYALCWLCKLPAASVARGKVPYILWLMIAVHMLCYLGLNYQHFHQASDKAGWQAFFSFSCLLTLVPFTDPGPSPAAHSPVLWDPHPGAGGHHRTEAPGQPVGNNTAQTGKDEVDVCRDWEGWAEWEAGAGLLANWVLYLCAVTAPPPPPVDAKNRSTPTPKLLPAAMYPAVRTMHTHARTHSHTNCLCRCVMLEGMKKQANQNEVQQQFNTMYMYRHENDSILFRDIVGFTQLSLACSAQELVMLLNELFARFDKLAAQHHQLLIKILGDCYYCICGLPGYCDDHTACSIMMGLGGGHLVSMCVRRPRGRWTCVWVHTGTVLGRLLGQRRWQFGVWSNDVTVESGGIPG